MNNDIVGIVVIGRNEGERLVQCLASVRAVTKNVVYVDSGSTDGSVAAAVRAGASLVALDLSRPFTAARARNEGFLALKRLRPDIQFVQFVDGDCVLAADWVERAFSFMLEREEVAVTCGRRRERFPTASIYNWLFDLEWNTPIGETEACGGDSLVRVKAFEEAGGFCSRLMAGEEPELCSRLRERGWKVFRLDAEMTLHDAAMKKFSQWWMRCVRTGYGFAEVSRLHRKSRFRIWTRAVPSALFWGGLLPVFILALSFINPLFLCAGIIYPLELCWIAVRSRIAGRGALAYAAFIMVGKFAQTQGIAKFYWYWSRGQAAQLVEYKV